MRTINKRNGRKHKLLRTPGVKLISLELFHLYAYIVELVGLEHYRKPDVYSNKENKTIDEKL